MQEPIDIQLANYVDYLHPVNIYLNITSDKNIQKFLKDNDISMLNILMSVDNSINEYFDKKTENSTRISALYEWKDEFENSNTDMIIEIRDDFLEKTDVGKEFNRQLDKQYELDNLIKDIKKEVISNGIIDIAVDDKDIIDGYIKLESNDINQEEKDKILKDIHSKIMELMHNVTPNNNKLYLAEKTLENLKENNEKLIYYIDDYIFYRAAEKYNMFLLDEKIKESPNDFKLIGLSESYLVSKNNIKENEVFLKFSEQEKSDTIYYFDKTEHYDREYIENKKQLCLEEKQKITHNRIKFKR